MKYADYLDEHSKRCKNFRNLKFPHETLRPGQKELMHTVLDCIIGKEVLFLHAPTGIGKTITTVYPALKALSTQKYSNILYLTAKTSTRNEVKKALKNLYAKNRMAMQAIFLSTVEELCPNHQYCPPSFLNDKDVFKEALAELFAPKNNFAPKQTISHIDSDSLSDESNFLQIIEATNLIRVAANHTCCPFHLMQEALPYCEIIVGDYNHVFDPFVRLRNLLDAKNSKTIWLIDEAHNMLNRTRNTYSSSLSLQNCKKIWVLISRYEEKFDLSILKELFKNLFDYYQKVYLEKENYDELDRFMPLELKPENEQVFATLDYRSCTYRPLFLEKLLNKLYEELKNFKQAVNNPAVFDLLSEFNRKLLYFLTILKNYWQKGFLFEANYLPNDIILSINCLDVAEIITRSLNNKHLAIFFSGSLTPLYYYKTMLSSSDIEARTYLLDSPFPEENFCVLQTNFLKNDFKNRDNFIHELCKTILLACSSKKGKYLVFLPSFKYLEKTVTYFRNFIYPYRNDFLVIQQTPRQNKVQSKEFLAVLNDPSIRETVIAFAVLGGGFSEGIDLYDNQLKGVILVGLGLETPSPQLEILKSYYDEKIGNGFFYAYRSPGFNKLLQAAGRVIRSETDRGFVIFCDERLSKPEYACLFPNHYRLNLVNNLDELKIKLANFWQKKS